MKFNKLNQLLNEGSIASAIVLILTLLSGKISNEESIEFQRKMFALSSLQRHETLGELKNLIDQKKVDVEKASFIVWLLSNWDEVAKDKKLMWIEIKNRLLGRNSI